MIDIQENQLCLTASTLTTKNTPRRAGVGTFAIYALFA